MMSQTQLEIIQTVCIKFLSRGEKRITEFIRQLIVEKSLEDLSKLKTKMIWKLAMRVTS